MFSVPQPARPASRVFDLGGSPASESRFPAAGSRIPIPGRWRFLRPFGAGVLKHKRFHGFRTARRAVAGASPVATVRRPVGAKNARHLCPFSLKG